MLKTALVYLVLCIPLVQGWFTRSKPKYTPLVFFKGPKGTDPATDALDECVRSVEEELNVHVERLVIDPRHPARRATLNMLEKSPPTLYHRESRQIISLGGEFKSKKKKKIKDDDEEDDDDLEEVEEEEEEEKGEEEKGGTPEEPITIDKDRVLAWAKGRRLPKVVKADPPPKAPEKKKDEEDTDDTMSSSVQSKEEESEEEKRQEYNDIMRQMDRKKNQFQRKGRK